MISPPSLSPLARALILFLAVLIGISSGHAQEWFTQRTFQGTSVPVINGVRDRFASGPGLNEFVDDDGNRIAFIGRDPILGNTFSAPGLPLSIPDSPAPASTSTIVVPAVAGALGVRVSLFIEHTYRGDLLIQLARPDGVVLELLNREGGGTDNVLIDNLELSVPAGFDPQGAWVLSIQDFAGGDTGQLQRFTLTVPSANDGVEIDLVVGLESNPTGDDDGNTQGVAGSEQQDKWERIMQHFADGVYEMTEGRHRIRQIRIFRNSRNFGAADIRWSASGHPHVPANGGVGVPGGHINMYESFVDGAGPGMNYDMLADEVGAGYTQAHEWGHFFLGVYDEYVTAASDVAVRPSVMSSQWNAVGGDYRWLNFSIKRQSGGDFQNTLFNWQHRAYAASAWEVLSRPVADDPRDQNSRRYQSLGPRVYYPELASAAPVGAGTPRIDLPSATARGALDIIWMLDNITMEIVIDNSGSMAGNAMEQAKTAAQLLVDQVTLGQARVGVTIFNSTVNSIMPLTDVATEADRTAIKNAIAAVSATGSTAIGDAAASALAKLLAGDALGDTRVVFLLSDGVSNAGRDPLSVIPDYTAAKVPLFTLAFGSGADIATLQQMATGTGGGFFASPTTLAQISAAFLAANQAAQSTPGLGNGSLSPAAGSPGILNIPVDSTLERLRLTIVYGGSAPVSAVTVAPPGGVAVAPTQISTVGTETLLFFDVENPAPGAWVVTTDPSAAGTTFSYTISGVHAGVGLDVSTGLQGGGTTLSEPGPVILESKLSRREAIAGATVACTVSLPDSSTVAVALVDDGVFPDLTANDGTYTGTFLHAGQGIYSASVQFSNAALTARETYAGSIGSPAIDGRDTPPPPDKLVGEDFSRSQTLQFTVATDVIVVSPSFATHPSSQLVVDGGMVSLAAAATGAPVPSYQWQRSIDGGATWVDIVDGPGISGATAGTMTLSGLTLAANGDEFRAVATNDSGSENSQTSILTVVPSPSVTADPLSTSALAGDAITLSVGAIASGPITYQWRLDNVDIPEATGVTHVIPNAQRFHAGAYTVRVTSGGNSVTSTAGNLSVGEPPASNSRLVNISTRGLSLSDENVLIPGFVISGTASKRLLIRAVGPTLSHSPYDVAGTLDNPRMALKRLNFSTQPPTYEDIAENDDWGASANAADILQAAAQLHAFPLEDDHEAALLVDLAPGQYTVVADGIANGTGVAIVEVYDADSSSVDARLINISNRGFVGQGDEVMIPGFVVSAEGPKTLLVRVVGPALTGPDFNVSGTMADPKLTVYSGELPILENDNWSENPDADYTAQVAQVVSAFPLDVGSADAAFVVTLQPGSYTIVGSSADGVSTGIVLVEVYVVP